MYNDDTKTLDCWLRICTNMRNLNEKAPNWLILEKNKLKSVPNWKSPGPDTGWRHGNPSEWLYPGRPTLIIRNKSKGSVVDNYRPILCFNLLWKLLTGIFADYVYGHLSKNQLLPDQQKVCRKGSRGAKDHLSLDKAIVRNCKWRKTKLDFKKACRWHGPHSWTLKLLKMFGIEY